MDIKPMLAAKVKPERIKELMADEGWVAELKLDGCRYCAEFRSDAIHFTSRRSSVKNGKPVDKSDNIPHLSKHNGPSKKLIGTVLDGEIMCPDINTRSNNVTRVMGASPELAIARQREEGKFVYHVFDILFYKGRDVQGLPYFARRKMMKEALAKWVNEYAVRVKFTREKDALLGKAWKHGLEGIILKRLDAYYHQDARNPMCWVKVKKEQDFDAVIMGAEKPEKYTYRKHLSPGEKNLGEVFIKGQGKRFKTINRLWNRGWIKSIVYGAYDGDKLVPVGTCSGMDDETRAELTGEGFSLNPKYHKTVFEFVGQEFQKAGVRHPRFTRFRDDKDAKDCKLKDLKNAPKEDVRYA